MSFVFFVAVLFPANVKRNQSINNEEKNNLSRAIKEKNGIVALKALQKITTIPDVYFDDLVKWCETDGKESDLRVYVIRLLSSHIESAKSSSVIIDQVPSEILIRLIKSELQFQIQKSFHNNSDLDKIKFTLELVSRGHYNKLLYDAIVFIAFPLLEVRHAAFKAVGSLNDDRVFPIVMQLASSKKAIERTYALDALYYIKDDRTTPLLLKALKDKNKSVRYYAIRTLEKMKRNEAVPYFIRIIQSDADDEVRIKAINVLGKQKSRSALYSLNKIISDKNQNVRKAVLESLLHYNDKSSCYYISKQLEKESINELKLQQIEALISLDNSGGMHGLNKKMSKDLYLPARIWASYATGYLKDFRGYKYLLLNLRDKNNNVKVESIYALAKFKDKRAVSALMKILQSDKIEYLVQAASLYAISEINYNKTIPALFDLSENHKNIMLREQIKKVLRKMLKERF